MSPKPNKPLLLIALFLALAVLLPHGAKAAEKTGKIVPRVIMALYSSRIDADISDSLLNNLAEMPLNHLGLKFEYYDIEKGLPDIKKRPDVRGIITWFPAGMRMKDPLTYIAWATAAVDSGKRYVIMANPGFYENMQGRPTSDMKINAFLNKIGLQRAGRWISVTHDVTYSYNNSDLFPAGPLFDWRKPAYEKMEAFDDSLTVQLMAHKPSFSVGDSVLIATGPKGSYASEAYLYRFNVEPEDEIRQWTIDPFVFFRLAFATDDLPKPDTNTLAGRRIYYSHIDGDGWNNYVRLVDYKDKPAIAAQVMYEKLIKPFPELPVTVTAIAADLDPTWAGTPQSQAAAKSLFALPQVQAGTHTYSHPFNWAFFADGNAEKERPYLDRYRYGRWDRTGAGDMLSSLFTAAPTSKQSSGGGENPNDYFIPRGYANERFDIHKEVGGSVKEISLFLPPGKKVELLSWPGNCLPFEEALRLTREAGLANINGGDSRYDAVYPSYAAVAPLGRQVGKEQQIYSSDSNENTYTNLWSAKFHSFQYLTTTLDRTETPVRLKPINIYYHVYSAERMASLNAVLKDIAYVLDHPIIPLTAAEFSRIAQGFFTAEFVQQGPTTWQVRNRGDLQTIRFDYATMQAADPNRSRGVIGQRHYQGSLYVYFDSEVKDPVIALAPLRSPDKEVDSGTPYLIESHWMISHVHPKEGGLGFITQGFGKGEMIWHVPGAGRWQLRLPDGKTVGSNALGGLVHFAIDANAQAPLELTLMRAGS